MNPEVGINIQAKCHVQFQSRNKKSKKKFVRILSQAFQSSKRLCSALNTMILDTVGSGGSSTCPRWSRASWHASCGIGDMAWRNATWHTLISFRSIDFNFWFFGKSPNSLKMYALVILIRSNCSCFDKLSQRVKQPRRPLVKSKASPIPAIRVEPSSLLLFAGFLVFCFFGMAVSIASYELYTLSHRAQSLVTAMSDLMVTLNCHAPTRYMYACTQVHPHSKMNNKRRSWVHVYFNSHSRHPPPRPDRLASIFWHRYDILLVPYLLSVLSYYHIIISGVLRWKSCCVLIMYCNI